jgi:cell division initiation protein
MPITPVEIRHLQLRRGFLGYRRAVIDRALAEIADSFEQVWRQRADLADRIEELENEIKRHTELETLLRSTLVSAERAAQDVKEQARREADLIVTEAQAEARSVMRDAIGEKERLLADVRRIQALLRSALDAVSEQPAGPAEAGAEAKAEEAAQPEPEQSTTPPAADDEDSAVRRLAG